MPFVFCGGRWGNGMLRTASADGSPLTGVPADCLPAPAQSRDNGAGSSGPPGCRISAETDELFGENWNDIPGRRRAGVPPECRFSYSPPGKPEWFVPGSSGIIPGSRRKSIRCRESASAGFRICPSSRLVRIKWKRPGCLRASRSHREPERIIPACPRMSPMRPLSGATPAAVPQRKPASASRVYSLDITAGTITTSYPCLRASSAVYFFPSTVIWPPSGITYFKTIGAESILFT